MVFAKSWKPDGSICEVTKIVNGEGVTQSYHPSGPIEYRANIKNGYYEGLETWYYENGQKKNQKVIGRMEREGNCNRVVREWSEKRFEAKFKVGKEKRSSNLVLVREW